jgi:8-oxo-dGTP pyrophosphatase MutT (NUDIX family)
VAMVYSVALIILHNSEKRCLLQHRSKDALILPDHWAFFGGSIERDEALILESVRKTGNLIMTDTGWTTGGFGAEVIARVAEKAFADMNNKSDRFLI